MVVGHFESGAAATTAYKLILSGLSVQAPLLAPTPNDKGRDDPEEQRRDCQHGRDEAIQHGLPAVPPWPVRDRRRCDCGRRDHRNCLSLYRTAAQIDDRQWEKQQAGRRQRHDDEAGREAPPLAHALTIHISRRECEVSGVKLTHYPSDRLAPGDVGEASLNHAPGTSEQVVVLAELRERGSSNARCLPF